MAINVYTKGSFLTANWSGGKTTQLAILPAEASVDERNFSFRISTASVEIEESSFTNFSGYDRKLMVLEGELFIEHEEQYSLLLKPFDQDLFSGDWKTRSKGKVRDFNVIYKPELGVELSHHDIDTGSYLTLHKAALTYVYIVKGKGEVKGLAISEGDLIELDNEVLTSVHASSVLTLIVVELKNLV